LTLADLVSLRSVTGLMFETELAWNVTGLRFELGFCSIRNGEKYKWVQLYVANGGNAPRALFSV